MYNSQYYTCEQIDQRLLQGYLDDYNIQNNTNLTKAEFLQLLSTIIGKSATIDNLVTQVGYYECDTAAGTAAKVITVVNYGLFAGGSMKVKFVNRNTADNATLNINSTGEKPLYYAGERASASNTWEAGETVEVYYDGTNYYANNVAGGSGSGDGAFDVSVEYPTSGVDGGNTYTLEGALAVLNANLPDSKKKGGMSIKFIQSSDNKYVQARCIAQNFTTDVTQWQCVDNDIASIRTEIGNINARIGYFIETEEPGLYIVDQSGNIAMSYTSKGLDVALLSNNLLTNIDNGVNSLTYDIINN